jgi:hypothetical protein
MTLLRSNIEFAKRVFLDRLTTDDQKLAQPADIDSGPGDKYSYDPFNLYIGADCSGSAGIFIGAALHGPQGMSWSRQFSTESFPGQFPGFRKVTRDDLLSHDYPIKVCIMHGGGGPSSHMNISIDGIVMESNGNHGTCTLGYGAITQDSTYWNDWWVLDGPIIEDTKWRQPMAYRKGYDYAGGRPSGAAIKASGATFVCRYLTDGGPGLPGKQLLAGELVDLVNNQVGVVFNYETTATFMLGGAPAGTQCAAQALAYIHQIGGPVNPIVYFSADWDESPDQQAAVNGFLTAAAQVLGGPQFVGIYGAYYVCKRALDAGVCRFMWQTEAWSGGNIDSRVNIMQRNALGQPSVSGVQVDIDEAHTDFFGQWEPWLDSHPNPAPPQPTNAFLYPDQAHQIQQIWEQLFGPAASGWPAFGRASDGTRDKYTVEALFDIHDSLQK